MVPWRVRENSGEVPATTPSFAALHRSAQGPHSQSLSMEDFDDADLAALEALDAAAPPTEPPPSKRPKKAEKADLEVEPLSGIRISLDAKTRRLDRGAVAALASASAMRRLDEVPPLLRKTGAVDPPASWLTIGVLVEKSQPKAKSNGGYFSVWKLSDLRKGGAATTLSVLLFDEAYSESWKETVGAVFALLNPRILPAREEDDVCKLCVEKTQQLQRIGQACEFGLCKGERKSDGKPCGMWVNVCEGDGYCEYHAAAALRKLEAQQKAALAAAAAGPKRGGGGGQPASVLQHKVTYMNGAALPSGWAPPNAGVPKGLEPPTHMPRPSWSAANQPPALLIKPHAERIQEAISLLRSAGYTVTPPASLTSIQEPDPNSLRPFGGPSSMMAPPHLRAPRAASPPLLGHELVKNGNSSSGAGGSSGSASSSSKPSAPAPFPKPSAYPSTSKAAQPPPTTTAAAAAATDFERQFGGRLSADSKEGQKLLNARPAHADAEREKGREKLSKQLDVLGK